jgi:hypothetical protein
LENQLIIEKKVVKFAEILQKKKKQRKVTKIHTTMIGWPKSWTSSSS